MQSLPHLCGQFLPQSHLFKLLRRVLSTGRTEVENEEPSNTTVIADNKLALRVYSYSLPYKKSQGQYSLDSSIRMLHIHVCTVLSML
jgi:hypothetical protein